jgi:hypothetical protein
MEAVGGGVKAAVNGHAAALKGVKHFGLIGKIVHQPARFEIFKQVHCFSKGD